MNVPIIPVGPVSNVITVQPVTTTIPNREQGAGASPLSNLPQGTTVQGFVVNRDAQSNPILRTPLGDVRITSEVFLKTGSEVIFRVDASQSSLARIVTVDGLSTQDYSAQSARGLTRDTISPSGLQPATNSNPIGQAASVAAGTAQAPAILQAIVLQGTPQPAQPPSLLANALAAAQSGPLPIVAQLAQLRAGTPIKLTLLDLKLPPIAIPLGALPEPQNANLSSLLQPPRAQANTPNPPNNQPSNPLTNPLSNPTVAALPQAPIAGVATGTTQTPEPSAPAAASNAPARAASNPAIAQPLPQAAPPQNAQTAALPANAPPAQTATLSANLVPAQTAANIGTNVSSNANNQTSQPAIAELAKPTAPNQLVATVIGHDADGANILQTPFASLKIYTPQPLPTGTTLLVSAEFSSALVATQGSATSSLGAVPLPATAAQSLTALGEAIGWLGTNQPDVAHDAMLRVPNISHQLANGLLNYISGIRSGDIADIIGKRAMRLLEISNPELLSRMRQQVEQAQSSFVDSPLAQWNALPIPLFFGGELHAAKLYIHKEPPEETKTNAEAGRGQRFILEVSMSQLGPLQFDGFVRNHERGKVFDLMVRSNDALPAELSNGIREIFTSSMEATRMNGQVIFQPGQQHFVRPDAPSSPLSGTGVNTILA